MRCRSLGLRAPPLIGNLWPRVGQTIAVVMTEESPGANGSGRQVTPGRREPTESATESIPPILIGKGEMVG